MCDMTFRSVPHALSVPEPPATSMIIFWQSRRDLMAQAARHGLKFIMSARWSREADHIRILVSRRDHLQQMQHAPAADRTAVQAPRWLLMLNPDVDAAMATTTRTQMRTTTAALTAAPPFQQPFTILAEAGGYDVPEAHT
jgi:hypothetical protein